MASRDLGDQLHQTVLSVPTMHCAVCIGAVEQVLAGLAGVEHVRANLSMRRVVVNWKPFAGSPPNIVKALAEAGYDAHLPSSEADTENPLLSHLIGALSVSGFCSMNIMLLSVSVWSGTDPATRQSFHAISALLAVPAVFYGGISFYRSAWRALSHGRLNMDVPISVGVLLSFALSLYDTAAAAPHAYFEASTSLIFVLLAGRVLDHMMRRKARSAVKALARVMPLGASVSRDDGSLDFVPLSDVRSGMLLRIKPGERVPTDGVVVDGISDLDSAFLTGESAWRPVQTGSMVRAGELNRTGLLLMSATAAPEHSMLSEITRMLEAAEDGRSRYRRLADRAAGIYAPAVHSLAAIAFGGWYVATGNVHTALTVAIAVLIITCPCALGLAVPMVQVVLARRLFEQGVMANDGSAFERLQEIDTVVFDKTGTLTSGTLHLAPSDNPCSGSLALAQSLAGSSTHPLCKALWAYCQNGGPEHFQFSEVREIPGKGVEGRRDGDLYRLGRREWALAGDQARPQDTTSVTMSRNGVFVADFRFREELLPGAAELVAYLKSRGMRVVLLSGDTDEAVIAAATAVGIADCRSGLLPDEKAVTVRALQAQGRKVLMIGDGINDAVALRSAHASIAPAHGSDISRNAADLIYLGSELGVLSRVLGDVTQAGALVRQNFTLAVVYNMISVPIALLGYATPLAAAIAMSTSSLLVVANAMRLGKGSFLPQFRHSPSSSVELRP